MIPVSPVGRPGIDLDLNEVDSRLRDHLLQYVANLTAVLRRAEAAGGSVNDRPIHELLGKAHSTIATLDANCEARSKAINSAATPTARPFA